MSERDERIAHATKALVDQGKLIEAGWVGYQLMVLPKGASEIQVNECRLAFFAGAQHLFGSIMTVLDAGDEPTDDDMARMDLIDRELEEFLKQFKLDNSAGLR